jgi:hypothetical protein
VAGDDEKTRGIRRGPRRPGMVTRLGADYEVNVDEIDHWHLKPARGREGRRQPREGHEGSTR